MMKPIVSTFAALFLTAAPVGAQDLDAAQTAFQTAFGETCMLDVDSAASEYYPAESWTLTWQEEYTETEMSATLYQFFCFAGAYNVNLVYYIEDEFNGLVPLSFAVPSFDVNYVDDDFEGDVDSIVVKGFTTLPMLTNPVFDAETRTIENAALWRGLGDASSSGRWVFEKGDFVLKSYDVDATYDGEVNPERIVEYK